MDGADIQSRIKCEDLEFFQDAADYWINHSSNMSNHANLVKAEINRRAK